jgi:hypothetical protein
MSRRRRTVAEAKRRQELHEAALGLHPASATVAVAHRTSAFYVLRRVRPRREGPVS